MSGSHLPIGLEGVDFTAAYTVSTSVPEYPGAGMQVGTRVNAGNGGQWIFVVAGGSITANDLAVGQAATADDSAAVISTTSSFTASALSNTTAKGFLGKLVGKAGATVTSGQYFWLQVAGYAASVNAATSSAANTVLGSTTTAGRLGAASAGNSAKVTGLVLVATAASNTAAAILNFPAIGTDD